MSFKKKLALTFLGSCVFIAGSLFLNLNRIAKSSFETRATEILGVPVTVESLSLSFVSRTGSIRNLEIRNPANIDRPLLMRVETIPFKWTWGKLTSNSPVSFEYVRMEKPEIWWDGNRKYKTLSELGEAAQKYTNTDRPGPPFYDIEAFSVSGATVHVYGNTNAKNENPFNQPIAEIQVGRIGGGSREIAHSILSRISSAIRKQLHFRHLLQMEREYQLPPPLTERELEQIRKSRK